MLLVQVRAAAEQLHSDPDIDSEAKVCTNHVPLQLQ